MGFLDLSMSVASKKHVDFSDVRYQSADRLRRNMNQKIRSTFTLYDNKESNKTAIQEITAAYALSDKRIPVGELLNKMVDLIIDLEDGILDNEKDAIYAWKYSVALIEMYEDKIKRQKSLSMFDNSLKTSVINSKTFIERYPGKYTNRTNFFDKQVKDNLAAHIVETFKDVAVPAIHKVAITQSRERAEKHNNPVLDKIVQWAIENYGCKADSFFQIDEDPKTNLLYSVNTIIIHLKNGYDMSIVGYVGTEFDDQFAISVFDAQKIEIEKHDEHVSQEALKDILSEASANEPISPLFKLLDFETKKNEILKQQYDILINIRPMIPAEALQLKAAESVVGKDYIWGCEQFRVNHEDLPKDFKFEDIELPEMPQGSEQDLDMQKDQDALLDVEAIADSIKNAQDAVAQEMAPKVESSTADEQQAEEVHKYGPEIPKELIHQEPAPVDENDHEIGEGEDVGVDNLFESIESLQEEIQDLFEIEDKPKVEEKKFGDPSRVSIEMPILNQRGDYRSDMFAPEKPIEFDPKSTLLPGVAPIKNKKADDVGPSITQDAKPAPEIKTESSLQSDREIHTLNEPKPIADSEEKAMEQPDLILDDLDSLFE